MAWPAPFASRQERGPNGRIYNELLPFVGLAGVRFEVNGLNGVLYNTVGVSGDPETAISGFNRAEHDQLEKEIYSDTSEAFRAGGIPLLQSDGRQDDARPRLVLSFKLVPHRT